MPRPPLRNWSSHLMNGRRVPAGVQYQLTRDPKEVGQYAAAGVRDRLVRVGGAVAWPADAAFWPDDSFVLWPDGSFVLWPEPGE